jgi:hypothetical protein
LKSLIKKQEGKPMDTLDDIQPMLCAACHARPCICTPIPKEELAARLLFYASDARLFADESGNTAYYKGMAEALTEAARRILKDPGAIPDE